MKSARSTGWSMVGWSILLAFMLLIASFAKMVIYNHLFFLKIFVNIVSVPIWLLLIITTAYSIWGLRCGYNQKSWNRYCEQIRKNEEKMAKKLIAEEKMTR